MRISIAMCTYNGALHLHEQLDSFTSQSYPPNELIVCDDGSTDDTVSLIENFATHSTFPVRISRNERNLGSTKNFEKAISLCGGDLIDLLTGFKMLLASESALHEGAPSQHGSI